MYVTRQSDVKNLKMKIIQNRILELNFKMIIFLDLGNKKKINKKKQKKSKILLDMTKLKNLKNLIFQII